jgi:hypothetical protein
VLPDEPVDATLELDSKLIRFQIFQFPYAHEGRGRKTCAEATRFRPVEASDENSQ